MNKKFLSVLILLAPVMLAGCSTKCDCPSCPTTVVR